MPAACFLPPLVVTGGYRGHMQRVVDDLAPDRDCSSVRTAKLLNLHHPAAQWLQLLAAASRSARIIIDVDESKTKMDSRDI